MAGGVGADCGSGGGIGSGGFGGLSANTPEDTGFAGESAGNSTDDSVSVLDRTIVGATTIGFSATAGGEGCSATGGDVGFPATGFGSKVGEASKYASPPSTENPITRTAPPPINAMLPRRAYLFEGRGDPSPFVGLEMLYPPQN